MTAPTTTRAKTGDSAARSGTSGTTGRATRRSTATTGALAACAWATVAVGAHQIHRVFGAQYHRWPAVAATAITAVVAGLIARRSWPVRVTLGLASTAAATAVALALQRLPTGTTTGSSLRHITNGFADVMAAIWPAPVLGSGVAALSAVSAAASFVAVDLTIRRRTGAALLASLTLIGIVALLSAPAGPPSVPALTVYVLAALGVLRSRVETGRSTVALRYAALMTAVLVAVPALATGLVHLHRYDPRSSVAAPHLPDVGISPLARLDEWRTRTPPTPVFSTTKTDVTAWRLVGLTRYDGRTWLPADDYRLSSGQLIVSHGATKPVTVTVDQLDAAWLPAPQGTASVDQSVRVDGGRSGLLASTAPQVGTVYTLEVGSATSSDAELAGARAASPINPFIDGFEVPASLLQLASNVVAGAQSDLERAKRIEAYLRNTFQLDPGSPAGHSIAVEQLFIERTHRGRDEQFVAAYGILAAAVGLPVRIAVGFETDPTADGSGTVAESSSATAWPEIEFSGFGWIRFDPIPTTANPAVPGSGKGAVAPADNADTPPPPSTVSAAVATTLPGNDSSSTTIAAGATRTRAGAGTPLIATALIVLAAMAYVGAVVDAKRRRRDRRLADADPARRAVGAFASGVDVLVDLGTTVPRSLTDAELVGVAADVVGDPAHELRPVGALATAAVFGSVPISSDDADDAWRQVDTFTERTATSVGRWKNVRSQLSLRSLRHGLVSKDESPVRR